MNQPDNRLGAKKCLKWFFKAFIHTRINTSPVEVASQINVGTTNHDYIKVSDALRDMELQQPPHLLRCANIHIYNRHGK